MFLILFIGCNSQTCNELPKTFGSYEQAKQMVQSAMFEYRQKIDISSSWILWAEYLSCDKETGYFIFKTDKGKVYIHDKMPISVWNAFKSSKSKGSYYPQNIRGEYRLELTNR